MTEGSAGASGASSDRTGEPREAGKDANPPGEPVASVLRARPAFAADFPPDPALDALVDAFDAGDFARIRTEVPRLVASSSDEAVKRAATTLLARTRPDPLATMLLVISAVLLVLLSGWWIAQNGGGKGGAP